MTLEGLKPGFCLQLKLEVFAECCELLQAH